MARCLILTVIVECSAALIIGIRNRFDLINVALVNLLTNPAVVVSTFLTGFFLGTKARIVSVIIAECFAVVIEALIYRKTLEFKKINPFLLSLILNGISYGTGLIINLFTGG